MFHMLRTHYWWPKLEVDCATYTAHCLACQLERGVHGAGWGGTMIEPPVGPRTTWSLDLMTELPATFATNPDNAERNKTHIIVAVDVFSKFVLIGAIPQRDSTTVATFLRTHLIGIFGPPQYLRTDNGNEFKGTLAEVCDMLHITFVKATAYHKEANGQSEIYLRTIQTMLRRTLLAVPSASWRTLIPELQYTLNTTYASAIGLPPYLLMFGGPARPLVAAM
jgi:Integrase core domain/Integrase zinc binding domain